MSAARIRIWAELPKATIHPNIYGHFAEHLGRCIYEGIWVGPNSRIPNQNGLRLDILAALKQLRAPVVRWPGGCFADMYHWRDGIGPRDERPDTVNIWWQQSEPNEFGTDEFMQFCRAVGCEPFICLNVGSGTVQEAMEWLEYCNYGGDSTLTRLRAKSGSAEPYGVKYWAVGNENWGCGGSFKPDDYARLYTRFATYLRTLDPGIELIACGYGPRDPGAAFLNPWNHDFCQTMPHAHLIDQISIHRYFKRGTDTGFTDSEFLSLFGDIHSLERDIQATEQLLAYYYPDKNVGIAVDEWGVWHPSAVVENGLEQESTLRDALFAASCLNLFNRYAHRVTMANIAQTVNVLQSVANTRGGKMALTPTYHVFDMTRGHMGATLLTHDVECDTYETHPVGLGHKHPVPELSVSVSQDGGRVLVTVVNQTIDKDIETRLVLRDALVGAATAKVLASGNPRDTNSFDAPKRIVPKRVSVSAKDSEITHVFPRHSFTAIQMDLA